MPRCWTRRASRRPSPARPPKEGAVSTEDGLREAVARLLPARRGHFRLESGHHGDLWLDLERLCLDAEAAESLAAALATRLRPHDVQVVCGPLVEGAFVALLVARRLGAPFTYSAPLPDRTAPALYPVRYRLPPALRAEVGGRRVAIVNDVINAGSAVRGTFVHLVECGARPVAVASLATLGDSASRFAAAEGMALETLATLPNEVWAPAECPLCRRGVPFTDATDLP